MEMTERVRKEPRRQKSTQHPKPKFTLLSDQGEHGGNSYCLPGPTCIYGPINGVILLVAIACAWEVQPGRCINMWFPGLLFVSSQKVLLSLCAILLQVNCRTSRARRL